ncbi:hypothetical protein JEU11_13685 [Paraglaciecola chathamensis]|uniref:Uncharacterized protein n=1 Tax=Paraglaciecola chathamensis TaxID=368405 RepID=A0ABS0WGD5_9ALTE|nr:hypothetical protein [Paraglaciecola chathamensis]MBJ2137507.1 hypothetical protein [Paraglaciecola chathamensis]
MKEVIAAVNDRIKTPYFGYSILAFLALNWRGFFLLMLSKESAEDRIKLFDSQTSILTLLIYPLCIGAVISLTFHWLRYFFARAERKPRELFWHLELEAEHNKNIKQTELEKSRTELFSAREKELVDRAQTDEKVRGIEDEETKAKLAEQIKELRSERDSLTKESKTENVKLSKEALTLLKAASEDSSGKISLAKTQEGDFVVAHNQRYGGYERKIFLYYKDAIEELIDHKFIEFGSRNDFYLLTSLGWKFAEKL